MSDVSAAFEQSIGEGILRLERTWPDLLATGAVGGIDVSIGILGLLLVKQATGDELLAALAFGIGFVALTLAASELFTENFLVPITVLAARRASLLDVARLWAGTLVMNLVGGWVVMGLVMAGFPKLRPVAVEVARHYQQAGIGWGSFATAVLGGLIITLMTWMQAATASAPAKLVAAVSAAFLLAAGSLNHAIVLSLESFAALQAGAPFGYWAWAEEAAWAVLGNLLGGLGLVTALRLVQVGRDRLDEEHGRRSQVRRS